MPANHATSEAAIFGRVIRTGRKDLTPEVADYLLRLGFSDKDKARMHELAVRNQEANLSPEEREELENYVRVGDLLALLKANVRVGLQRASATTASKRFAMESIKVSDLPEPVARAIAAMVETLRYQLADRERAGRKGPVTLSLWQGTVRGSLSREEIYDDVV